MTAVVRRPSACLPMAMSLAAHVWQLLIVAQLPVIVYFAVTWLPRAPRPAWLVLAIQMLALVAAIAPVAILRW